MREKARSGEFFLQMSGEIHLLMQDTNDTDLATRQHSIKDHMLATSRTPQARVDRVIGTTNQWFIGQLTTCGQ